MQRFLRRFRTLELKIGSLESEKIGTLESEKTGSLWVHTGYLTFSLKNTWVMLRSVRAYDE